MLIVVKLQKSIYSNEISSTLGNEQTVQMFKIKKNNQIFWIHRGRWEIGAIWFFFSNWQFKTLWHCRWALEAFQSISASLSLLLSYRRQWTYPYHEDGFPDVTDAIVDQTGCINELVLLKGLWGVHTQCLDSYFHLFSKSGHYCRKKKVMEVEIENKRETGGMGLSLFSMIVEGLWLSKGKYIRKHSYDCAVSLSKDMTTTVFKMSRSTFFISLCSLLECHPKPLCKQQYAIHTLHTN